MIQKILISDKLYQQERELRNRVLLRPIGLPDFAWEMFDEKSSHFVSIENDKVIGCVLLFPDGEKAKLLQMAVDSNWQRKGIGNQLLDTLLKFAREKNITSVYCSAREDAIEFYLKAGFEIVSDYFEEVGVRHVKMEIKIL